MTSRLVITVAAAASLLLAALAANGYVILGGTPQVSDEEFVGPFPSWRNVKTACGAVGDGTTDDTAAIQTCLNGLSSSQPVLYFPAGTYKITSTLTLAAQLYVSLIGADPATTAILWAGNSAVAAANFTGTISTTGCPSSCVFTLSVSGVSGTIQSGQRLTGTGVPNPTVVVTNLGGNNYKIAPYSNNGSIPLTIGPEAMTSVNESMLYLNGNAYSRFARLTFNGQGNAVVAVDQSKSDNTSSNFDTANEYSDDVFENVGIGVRCGNIDFGCSETSMLRGKFINNTSYGILMKNFNALNMFVWYSLFQNNAIGVSNSPGAGNFHVLNSIFQGSTFADMNYGNTGAFDIMDNYSSGSNRFWYGGGSNSSNGVVIQGNTVLDTTVVTNGALFEVDYGPVVFIDNIIRSLTGTTGPVATSYGDLFSIGNIFTITPSETFNASGVGFHGHSIDDQVVPRAAINPRPPILPGTPPNLGRTVFETSPTGSGTACTTVAPCSVQQGVTNAANAEQTGSSVHPVVHIPVGSYSLTSTITVPATVNSGIQIIGDGYYSALNWANGASSGPVIKLIGPNKCILRDFLVNGINIANGIEATNVDQVGSRVFILEPLLSSSQTNLFVDALDYTQVEIHSLFAVAASAVGTVSTVITGGAQAAAGNWQGGTTNVWGGSIANDYQNFGVSNGAHVSLVAVWAEGTPETVLVANVTGISAFTYAGSAVNMTAPGGQVALALNNFQGVAALTGLFSNGTTHITGNGTGGKVAGIGMVGPSSTFFSDTSSPADTSELLNGQSTFNPPPGSTSSPIAEQGTYDPAFLTTALTQMRALHPAVPTPLPAGVTELQFYHVNVSSALTGLHLH